MVALPIFRINVLRQLLLAASLVFVAACRDATGPRQDPPFIEGVSIHARVFTEVTPHEGSLRVVGRAADVNFVVTRYDRFEVHLASSSGDRELLNLGRALCGSVHDGSLRTCGEILLEVKPGFSLTDVYPTVRKMGRYGGASLSRFAGVRLFGVSEQQAIGRLNRHPLVRSAELAWVGFPGALVDPQDVANRALAGQMKIDARPSIPHNGILEASLGDTIEVRYRQPDGSDFIQRSLVARSDFIAISGQ